MSKLIGQITLQPSVARPGQTVRVEVHGAEENAANGAVAQVTINGTPGAVQYLQFPTVGQRRLLVMAKAPDGVTDQEVALVDIQGEPVKFNSLRGLDDIAMIGVTQAAAQPYEAILTLGSFIDMRTPPKLTVGPTLAPGNSFLVTDVAFSAKKRAATTLSDLLTTKAKGAVKVETRRLTRIASRRCPPDTASRQKAGKYRPARKMVSAIYDLGTLDVGKGLAEIDKLPQQRYEWDFGDGVTAVTRTPTVRHDYFAAIDHQNGTGQFVVTCRVTHSKVTVQRTLTIQSAYTLCKRTGTIAPHVVSHLFAQKKYNMLTASFIVHNVEDEMMILDRLSITAISDDHDAMTLPRPFVNLTTPIAVAPKSKTMVGVNVPFVVGPANTGQLSHDVKGFTALYAGRVGDMPVRCTAVFDIPVADWGKKPTAPNLPKVPDLFKEPWPWEIVEAVVDAVVNPVDAVIQPGAVSIDKQTATIAVAIGPLGATPAQIRDQATNLLGSVYAPITKLALEQRRQLMSGKVGVNKKLRANLATKAYVPKPLFSGWSGEMHALSGPPPPGMVAEGQICDPDNLDEAQLAQADAGQLVCQLTNEVMDVLMPARWMNARKGDAILSPGGEGIIGGLMLNVSPPQWYSHSGIMTRNYDEITHSTGSQKRLMDHLIGIADGSDGFEPHILKYIWPGAITQSVEHSIAGEDFPDPEFDKTYSISAFGPHTVGVTHNDQMKMIPPLVLKPDPMQETPAVRSALHAIATDAKNNAGRPGVNSKFHYRWFCYTNPQIGLGAPEGSGAGWAAGTRASVCSSYIWMHAKGRNAQLETNQALVTPTDLEPGDVATGAAVRPVTPDGLYTYSAEERLKAGEWLYNKIYNEAYEKAGWLGNILTDAADDIANQFLNAFENDDADGKDSDEWREVESADAISPDDMLWWDGPDKGGLYGFSEPAKYREPRIESYTVSRWKKVLNRGTVRGRVLSGGVPVAGAMVQVYEGKTDFSNADGTYSLTDVPLGPYQLKATKVVDAVLKSVQVNINLQAADLVVDLHLQDPPDRYRIAQVFIDFWGRDEETFGSDEIHDPGPEYFELELGPDKLINTATRTYKWGGEMRLEYVITLRLLVNNTIDVDIQGKLYEGTSEDTSDLDGTGSTTFQVGVLQTQGATLSITNTQEDDEDEGVLSISVKNVRNDS